MGTTKTNTKKDLASPVMRKNLNALGKALGAQMAKDLKEIKKKRKTKEGLEQLSLIPALKEIERMIEYFKDDMDFKGVRVTPIIQTQGRRKTNGHFYANMWQAVDGTKHHEIQITAEHLTRPAMEIASTIRHELVHAKNHSTGVSDTSNNGVYHNKRFKESAERYGLTCAEKTNQNGHGITTLSAELEAQLIVELKPSDEAFTLVRVVLAKRPPKTKGKMLKWVCGCTQIRAAVEVKATCSKPDCGKPFIKV